MLKLLAFVSLFASIAHAGEIITKEVSYPAGEITAKGFLAIPAKKGPHPGVLVVHEWWGANDYPRERAKKLAELGYTALAIDMYGEGQTTEHPKDAGGFASSVKKNQTEMIARFKAAMDFLKAQSATDNEHLAAIGYCFGGNVAMQMAYNGLEGLDGVASFHGALGLQKPVNPKKPTAKILVCNGADDSFISAKQIAKFKETMKEAEIDFQFHNYEGAIHGFTNKEADKYGKAHKLPLAYNAKADAASWKELQTFLAELFQEN